MERSGYGLIEVLPDINPESLPRQSVSRPRFEHLNASQKRCRLRRIARFVIMNKERELKKERGKKTSEDKERKLGTEWDKGSKRKRKKNK